MSRDIKEIIIEETSSGIVWCSKQMRSCVFHIISSITGGLLCYCLSLYVTDILFAISFWLFGTSFVLIARDFLNLRNEWSKLRIEYKDILNSSQEMS